MLLNIYTQPNFVKSSEYKQIRKISKFKKKTEYVIYI